MARSRSRSLLHHLIALLLFIAAGQAMAQEESESFQGQMSHSLGRTSSVSVSTGTSLSSSASASMDPGYDAISVSRVDLSPQAYDAETGILDSSLPRLATRVNHSISNGTGVTSNTLSSSSQIAKSTSQDWINQARSSADEAVGSSFYDYAQGVLNEGETSNPEIKDAESWKAQWDSNYNTAYEDVLNSASDEEKAAVDRYQTEEQSQATGNVTTKGLQAETNVALSGRVWERDKDTGEMYLATEGTGFSTVVTPRGYVYDQEASIAKGAPVYTCQSASCEYETPVLTRDGLIEQINNSHLSAKSKASQDIEDRVSAAFPSFASDQVYDALVHGTVDVSVPTLYSRDDSSGTPVYTELTSASLGQEVYVLDADSNEYKAYTVPNKIYQKSADGVYTEATEILPGLAYVDGLESALAYESAKSGYESSSNLFSSDEVKTTAVSQSYGDAYEPGRVYPQILKGSVPAESDYRVFRDRYAAHVNQLNYDSVYDSEYREQVDGWLTGDQKILSNRQDGQGSAGVGVSTNMNVTTRNDSFQQAFIQAFR